MYYIRETEGKHKKLKIKGKMRIRIIIFIYTILFQSLCLPEGEHKIRKHCDRNFHRSNMWQFLVTQYNSSLSSFVPNFRILVAEKSLTEKITEKQTNRQTNIITEKEKTICPLYTSYRGIIIVSVTKGLVRLICSILSNVDIIQIVQ